MPFASLSFSLGKPSILALSTKAATITGLPKDGAMASLGVISKGRIVASNNALVSMGLFWRNGQYFECPFPLAHQVNLRDLNQWAQRLV